MYSTLCAHRITPSLLINMKTDQLVTKARKAATLWLECDDALSEVEETYGTPWEAARQTLTSALTIADGDGIDLEPYQGPESLFRFPEMGTMVMVRISRVPVPTDELDRINIRIEKLERELQLARNKRKAYIAALKIKAHDFVTEKISTAFKRIAQ